VKPAEFIFKPVFYFNINQFKLNIITVGIKRSAAMKKRILIVLLTLALAVALVVPMAVPVAAQGITTINLTVVPGGGYEIFPGIVSGGNRYGATFVAQMAGDGYKGLLTTSTNYLGASPTPGGTNLLIGGSWSLTLTKNGKMAGTIIGTIDCSGGSVTWSPASTTNYGDVYAPVTFSGISKTFAGKTGTGFFKGQDVHRSNFYLFGIEVPIVTGGLTLNFSP
jgi:hypothetical protein